MNILSDFHKYAGNTCVLTNWNVCILSDQIVLADDAQNVFSQCPRLCLFACVDLLLNILRKIGVCFHAKTFYLSGNVLRINLSHRVFPPGCFWFCYKSFQNKSAPGQFLFSNSFCFDKRFGFPLRVYPFSFLTKNYCVF